MCVTCQSLTISKSLGNTANMKTFLSHSQTDKTSSSIISMEQSLKSMCANSILSESKLVYLTSQKLKFGLFLPVYLCYKLAGLKSSPSSSSRYVSYPSKNVGLLSILSPGREADSTKIRSLSVVMGTNLSCTRLKSRTMMLCSKSRSNLL